MYGPDEARTAGKNQRLWSYGVKWNSDRFYASLHQERHYDFFGGSVNIPVTALKNDGTAGAHSRDVATRASGEFRMGDHRFTLDIARIEWKETGQAAGAHFEKLRKNPWAIGWEARWGGPWGTAVQYIRSPEGKCSLTVGDCSASGLKGQMLTGGVRYIFDRQTFVYLIAARLTNDKSALFSNASVDPARGGETSNVALGISYTF
jgi:hypothetical protein